MPPDTSRHGLRQALVLYGITLAVTVGLTLLSGVVGWLRGYMLVFVAATFLYLPIEVLYRGGEDPADFGIHRRRPWRSLRLAALMCLVLFPPYLVGFHVWQGHWLKRHLDVAGARFDRWPLELDEAPPARELDSGEVRLYANDDNDRLTLRWRLPRGHPMVATLRSDGPVHARGGSVQPRHVEGGVELRGGDRGWATLELAGRRLELDVEAARNRLPPGRLRLGVGRARAEQIPYHAERKYWWILNIILVQLLLVALPEEVFYRGYLQTRFDAAFGRDRRVLGVDVNVASLVATSALFAVGHFLTIPSPQRLAVFFPSLLFGWMRRATGGVVAGVVFHAACNLLVEFARRFYGL